MTDNINHPDHCTEESNEYWRTTTISVKAKTNRRISQLVYNERLKKRDLVDAIISAFLDEYDKKPRYSSKYDWRDNLYVPTKIHGNLSVIAKALGIELGEVLHAYVYENSFLKDGEYYIEWDRDHTYNLMVRLTDKRTKNQTICDFTETLKKKKRWSKNSRTSHMC